MSETRPGDAERPEADLPEPEWGRDLNSEHWRARKAIKLSPVKAPPVPTPASFGERAQIPRFCTRAGLFAIRPTVLTRSEERRVAMGDVLLRGTHMSAEELRTLTIVSTMALAQRDRVQSPLRIPGATVLRYRGKAKSAGQVERVRMSLGRLCDAEFALEVPGFGTVGSPTRPERFLMRDESRDDIYHLRPWFAELLRKGTTDSYSGVMERQLAWPLVAVMSPGALLLYMYLECETWRRAHAMEDPGVGRSGEAGMKKLFLEAPMLFTLGLDGRDRRAVRRALTLALRTICRRDWRYRGFQFEERPARRRGERGTLAIRVFKRNESSHSHNRWLGRLCKRCRRPDQDDVCCCTAPEPCGQRECPRCREEGHAPALETAADRPWARLKAV